VVLCGVAVAATSGATCSEGTKEDTTSIHKERREVLVRPIPDSPRSPTSGPHDREQGGPELPGVPPARSYTCPTCGGTYQDLRAHLEQMRQFYIDDLLEIAGAPI
jgi:hypothetical protein